MNTRPATIEALPSRLVHVHPHEATASRLAFDTRAQRWLAAVFGVERVNAIGAPLRLARGSGDAALRLRCHFGEITLGADLSHLPAAMVALSSSSIGSQLAAELLAGVLDLPWQALERALPGLRIEHVAPRSMASSAAIAWSFGGTHVELLNADPAVVQHLLDALVSVGRAEPLQWHLHRVLRLRGRVQVLQRALPLATLAGLRRGDLVMLGAADGSPGRVPVRIVYGEVRALEFGAEMDMQASTLTVTSEQRPVSGMGTTPEVAADESTIDVGELMLNVVFEIDTASISVAELTSMRPGYVVELDVPLPEAPVRLVTNGQTVGQGQLVAIGDRLGVRIERTVLQRSDDDDAAIG